LKSFAGRDTLLLALTLFLEVRSHSGQVGPIFWPDLFTRCFCDFSFWSHSRAAADIGRRTRKIHQNRKTGRGGCKVFESVTLTMDPNE
jgi:hypothetical protein